MRSNRQQVTGLFGLFALLGLFVLVGCSLPELNAPAALPPGDDLQVPGMEQEPPPLPRTGINTGEVTVTGISPAHGPFSGGNSAEVRGSGFTDDSLVEIDGRMVQPRDTLLVDANTLSIVVPAGEVGAADVEVLVGEERALLEDAYSYNTLAIDPPSGSLAGGTRVEITVHGQELEPGVQVRMGDEECTDPQLITPRRIACFTPAGALGRVDVEAYWSDNALEPIIARDAYSYVETSDPNVGGLNGEAIDGSINVTVIDSGMGRVVPGAFVLVGDDLDSPYQGETDVRGQITFSDSDLVGPVSVHVAIDCYEKNSIVSFDASNVTVFVKPVMDLRCVAEPDGGGSPGRGVAGSLISGELIFPGSEEFGINGWEVVPEPLDGELRVAYVYTTRGGIEQDNPSPASSGGASRITENSPKGKAGFPYLIFARPAGLAVYALAGIERTSTGEFSPYVMGVARDVVTAPGAETEDVDILMDITLDRRLQVAMTGLPKGAVDGPDNYRTEAHVDLGGEGVIVRRVNGQRMDAITKYTAGSIFDFLAQPALVGSLRDARYQVVSGWYTSADLGAPYTELVRYGVEQSDELITLDGFLGIPQAIEPRRGELLPEDRILRWETQGEPPDMYILSIVGGDDLPAWRQIIPGTQTQTVVPDFSSVEGLGDIEAGFINWEVRAVNLDGFSYDSFQYPDLRYRYWTHNSVDSFLMKR